MATKKAATDAAKAIEAIEGLPYELKATLKAWAWATENGDHHDTRDLTEELLEALRPALRGEAQDMECWRDRQTGRYYVVQTNYGTVTGVAGPFKAMPDPEEETLFIFDGGDKRAPKFDAERTQYEVVPLPESDEATT